MLRVNNVGPRAVLTIDDPERRNPMSLETMAALVDAVTAAATDDQIREIVITGAGDKAFSAGCDLS